MLRERGIGWHLARTWEGTRTRERAIKARAEGPRLCPDCTPHPRPVARGRSAQAQPGPRPEMTAEPGPRPWPWPGRPDPEAAADGYAKYQDVTDALIAQWRAEIPAPREPEPEMELEI